MKNVAPSRRPADICSSTGSVSIVELPLFMEERRRQLQTSWILYGLLCRYHLFFPHDGCALNFHSLHERGVFIVLIFLQFFFSSYTLSSDRSDQRSEETSSPQKPKTAHINPTIHHSSGSNRMYTPYVAHLQHRPAKLIPSKIN